MGKRTAGEGAPENDGVLFLLVYQEAACLSSEGAVYYMYEFLCGSIYFCCCPPEQKRVTIVLKTIRGLMHRKVRALWIAGWISDDDLTEYMETWAWASTVLHVNFGFWL